ncbi:MULTISPECIES: hypothetical protein [unclassified Bradyrhizobium]|uniref:hypothetical protein n=1 Tax=unclassified Bradyrhizobium TaxID=2631580 RepID=UPI002FEFED85
MKPATAFDAAQSLAGRDNSVPFLRVDGTSGTTGWLLAAIAGLLVWQMALSLALLGGAIELGAYAVIHFAACLALGTFLIRRLSTAVSDDRYSTALQVVVWSAVAGPFGTFVAAALLVPTKEQVGLGIAGGDVDSLTSDDHAIGNAERLHISLLDHRIRLEGASHVHPLMDVLVDGSPSEKLEALGVIYQRYETQFSPVLKRALRDPDASVRVLAATVMARLHAAYSSRIGDCQSAAATGPALGANWRNLAEVRLAYAESGLLESSRARVQVELAVGDLVQAVELDPADLASASRLGEVRQQWQRGHRDCSSGVFGQGKLKQWVDNDRQC